MASTIVKQKETPQELGVLQVDTWEPDRRTRRQVTQEKKNARKRLYKQYDREVKHERVHYIPGRRYGLMGLGAARAHNFRGPMRVTGKMRRATSFTVSTAYPFVASGSLGVPGVCLGSDETGGGAFYFDPWELYAAGILQGTSMVILGSVGTGKSTCVKSIVTRLVLAGRRAVIMTDKKGEWAIVSAFVGGLTIAVGTDSDTVINPLDEGNRPSTDAEGRELTDQKWAKMVRARRLSLLGSIVGILDGKKMKSSQKKVMRICLDAAVAHAAAEGRVPVMPDVMHALEDLPQEVQEKKRLRRAAGALLDTLSQLTDGDLVGMFDGESTVRFDATAPMVVFNTQGLDSLSEEGRKIAYACTQSWAESMITSRDFGQRAVVYEEGLDAISDAGSLSRMVTQVKLARAYGIFNILVLHKLGDLDMAGDVGSKTRAQALSLLGDSDIRVIYHQNPDQHRLTQDTLGLTSREIEKVGKFGEGVGLWKLGEHTRVVRNTVTKPEKPVFDTNAGMNVTVTAEAGAA